MIIANIPTNTPTNTPTTPSADSSAEIPGINSNEQMNRENTVSDTEQKTPVFKIVLVRIDPNYGERFHKGIAAAHFLKTYLHRYYRGQREIEVEIIEFNSCWPHSKDLDVNWLLDAEPHLVGFSCYCWNLDAVVTLARSLKMLRPQLPVITGGPEVSFRAVEILEMYPAIDLVVRGEGEVTFLRLIEAMANHQFQPSQIDGITYRHHNQILSTCDRAPIMDLDTLPSPILEGLVDPVKTDGEVMMETVRGCPYKCTYCLHTKGISGVRSHSLERIKEELERLCRDPRIKVIWFADPTFDANENRALQIMDLILEVNPQQRVAFELRAEILTPAILDRLGRLCIEDVGIGLQSVKPETLKILRRPFNKEKFLANLKILKESFKNKDASIFIDIIFGLPGDSFRDYLNTVDFSLAVGGIVYYQPLRVFEGTVMAQEAKEQGIVCQPFIPHNILHCNTFSLRDMRKAYRLNAGLDFYQSRNQTLKQSMDFCIQLLDETPATFFTRLGQALWERGLRHYFRVSNASPDDIPINWRIQDFLAVLDSWLDKGIVSAGLPNRLREKLEEQMHALDPGTGSSYFHAAL